MAIAATPPQTQKARRTRPAVEGVALLRGHPVFGALDAAQLQQLGSYARTRRVPNGTTIFAKGDPGDGEDHGPVGRWP
jgi:hypothetical protein